MQFKRWSFNKMYSPLTEQKFIHHVEPPSVQPGDTTFIQGPKYVKCLAEQI